jgi:hypothetical protein
LVAFKCQTPRLRHPCGNVWNDELIRLRRNEMQVCLKRSMAEAKGD